MSWSGILEFPSVMMPGKTWRLQKDKILGKGSYGLASLAHDVDTERPFQRPIVVKEVSLGYCKDEKELNAIFGEINILKQVRHPNVVQFIDNGFFEQQQLLYIIMEYCDGGDLAELITQRWPRRKPLAGGTAEEICSIFIQLLLALKHLHFDHRIIHRDLKPQNVFMTSAGVVKLGDFGVSTILSGSVDFAQTFCGSPQYLAPELCEEKPYNGKADLWSLGCILYEMLSHNEKVFKGRNLMALVQQIVNCNFTPIEEINNQPSSTQLRYPPELCTLVGLLLKKAPDDRMTLSRLLRHPYLVQNAAHVLPQQLLENDAYMANIRQGRIGNGRLPANFQASSQQSGLFGGVSAASVLNALPSADGPSHQPHAIAGRRATPPPASQQQSYVSAVNVQGPSGAAASMFSGTVTLDWPSQMPPAGLSRESAAAASGTGGSLPPNNDPTPYDNDEFEDLDEAEMEALEEKVYNSWSVSKHPPR